MINVEVQFDWEAAKKDLMFFDLDPVIGRLVRHKNTDAVEAIKYLPTGFFDEIGMRYDSLKDMALNNYPFTAVVEEHMTKLMCFYEGIKMVHNEAAADFAFSEYKIGRHNT